MSNMSRFMFVNKEIVRCETCVFFAPKPLWPDWHICRKNPPQLVIQKQDAIGAALSMNTMIGEWPIVEKADWCGEWRDPIVRLGVPVGEARHER
jgi:hypothetical protein